MFLQNILFLIVNAKQYDILVQTFQGKNNNNEMLHSNYLNKFM